ncbi:MAG TPA: glycosyltransferase family 39 protein [Chloroflexota bacterium]|nr:glycosyltransferase family 39 protein [Chloroflexota bacterium]
MRPASVRTWRGWGEFAGVTAVAALICAAYLSFAQYGFDILEEGYFATNARAVQLGSLPYRDFDTPYTPSIFYLYAWLMDVFGPNIVTLRVVQVIARGLFGILLYAVGRQAMPPFFAALAPLLIIAIDSVPGVWSIHPAWVATPAMILAVLTIARYVRHGNAWWLLAAGIAAGVGFAFKQNLAAYGVIAALWLLVVCERALPLVEIPFLRHVGRGTKDEGQRTSIPLRLSTFVLRLVQVLALALLPLTAAVIVRPYWSAFVATQFVVPLLALSLVAVWWMWQGRYAHVLPAHLADAGARGLASRVLSFYVRPIIFLTGFSAVSLVWFIPLIQALDWHFELLGPIVGKIDPTGYYYPMDPPEPKQLLVMAAALALPITIAVLGKLRLWSGWGLALLAGTLAALAIATTVRSIGADDPWNAIDAIRDSLSAIAAGEGTVAGPAFSTGNLILHLPTFAFWSGMALLVRGRIRGQSLAANGRTKSWQRGDTSALSFAHGSRVQVVRLWYLASGAGLLLNQYPRMDEVHLLWSGGMLFVVGADVLHRWYRGLLRVMPTLEGSNSARTALCLSLVALPLFAALPIILARVDGAGPFFRPAATEAELTRPEGPYGLLRLNVPGDAGSVWLPGHEALEIQAVVEHLQAKTNPGEPIFAYPAIPGFYYLADRPNATAFNHVFAGMAASDEQLEMVEQLESVRYIVWDDGGARFWVQPGDNEPVTEYIRTHFRIERLIGKYAILSRDGWGPFLDYVAPGRA